jgi:hypothetical protein
MVNRRAGRASAQLVGFLLRDRGARRSGRGPWRTHPGRWSTGHSGILPQLGSSDPFPVIATLLWKRRCHYAPSRAGLLAVGTASAAALATQVTDQRCLRWSGGGQSWYGPLSEVGAPQATIGRHAASTLAQAAAGMEPEPRRPVPARGCCAYGHCAGLAWTLAVGRVGPMSHAVSVR